MLAQPHALSLSVQYRRLVWALGRSALCLKDLVPMIFCCPKDFADELGVCIVYMGLVGA